MKNKIFTDKELTELIIGAKKGINSDFETLVNFFNKYMEHKTRYLAKNSFMEYEDLKQIGLIGLMNGIKHYNEDNYKPKTFLAVCMQRKMLEEIKRLDADKLKVNILAEKFGLNIEETFSNYSNMNNDVLHLILINEMYNVINDIIEKNLNQRQQKYLKKYLLGYEIIEISKIKRENYKKVAQDIYRGRNKLKVKLKEYLIDDSYKIS